MILIIHFKLNPVESTFETNKILFFYAHPIANITSVRFFLSLWPLYAIDFINSFSYQYLSQLNWLQNIVEILCPIIAGHHSNVFALFICKGFRAIHLKGTAPLKMTPLFYCRICIFLGLKGQPFRRNQPKTRTPVGAPLHRRSRHQNQAIAQKLGISGEKVTSMTLGFKSTYWDLFRMQFYILHEEFQ